MEGVGGVWSGHTILDGSSVTNDGNQRCVPHLSLPKHVDLTVNFLMIEGKFIKRELSFFSDIEPMYRSLTIAPSAFMSRAGPTPKVDRGKFE